MNALFRRNYYFLPALAGLLVCFLSIKYANYQDQVQRVVLSLGVFLGVLRVLWGERTRPRFALSLGLITIAHALILIFFNDWFPLRSMWYLGILAICEIGVLVVLAWRIMGLHNEDE